MGALQPRVGREGVGWDCITANMLLFSRQTLFLRLINVFSGPCYPEPYACSVQTRRCSPLLFPLQAPEQPAQRSRGAQDTDAIAMEDEPSKPTLRKVQAIASARALGTSLATTDMIIDDSYSTS